MRKKFSDCSSFLIHHSLISPNGRQIETNQANMPLKEHICILVFLCCLYVCAGDQKCKNIGGTCKDYTKTRCGEYHLGLCNGGVNRRCCLPCGLTCFIKETNYRILGKDDKCRSSGGKCMHDSNYCPERYTSGKCGGPNSRKCCTISEPTCTSDYYGDIMNVDTTGASKVTAKQDKLTYSGVKASRKMAQTDKGRINKYRYEIITVAKEKCLSPALIAAIISRESRGGNLLKSDGYGMSDPNGYGLMQVDKRYHTPLGGPYSVEHIRQGAGILVDSIRQIQKKFPSWTKEQALKGGISAYNAGVGNVRSYRNMDVGTTGNDYANGVVARAKYFHENGY